MIIVAPAFRVNQKVVTPIGEGLVQQPFGVLDGKGGTIVAGFVVRVPLTDISREHLKQSNCLTPNAHQRSALFVFQEGQLKHASG